MYLTSKFILYVYIVIGVKTFVKKLLNRLSFVLLQTIFLTLFNNTYGVIGNFRNQSKLNCSDLIHIVIDILCTHKILRIISYKK